MPDERKERIAANESLFRVANERMADWEEQHAADSTELYYCECGDRDCRERVTLSKADYERVRQDSRHFFVVPGHEIPDVETLVELNQGWSIVEKPDDVAPIVERSDPRTDA